MLYPRNILTIDLIRQYLEGIMEQFITLLYIECGQEVVAAYD